MTTKLNPYINFNGNAKEAMEFYKEVFGGELTMSTFKEGAGSTDEVEMNQIMHAQLTAPNGMLLMASDTAKHFNYSPGTNISMSLSGEDEAELKGYWEKLSVLGKITQPLVAAPWGDLFGMLTDKFGIQWLVNITKAK